MEEFIDNLKVLLNAMGYKVLVPVPVPTQKTVLLHCESGAAKGKGFVSPGGFTVLKDSKISDHIAPSFAKGAKSYYELRQRLEANGTIKAGKFTKTTNLARHPQLRLLSLAGLQTEEVIGEQMRGKS